jgi:hypothetical protein
MLQTIFGVAFALALGLASAAGTPIIIKGDATPVTSGDIVITEDATPVTNEGRPIIVKGGALP